MGQDEPRRVEKLRDALFADDDLRRHGVTLFGASLNPTHGGIRVQIAAEDAARARAVFRRRYGDFVDGVVVAASAYLVEHVPWECWTDDGGKRVTIWLLDWTDGSELSPSHRESDEEVVITLSGPRWQGTHHDIGFVVRKDVELGRPLAGRRVLDGATGHARPNRALPS